MCWYSVEHAGKDVARAEAGQRLAVRKMHAGHSWVVKESELEKSRPTPVCLLDGTRALFRPDEKAQKALELGSDPEAVFRMTGQTKRDVFEFQDGRQVPVDDMPAGLIFDVLMVPGKEHLSEVLETEAVQEETDDREPVFSRLFAFARNVGW